MEVRSYAQRDIHQKTLFPLVDFWKQIGVAAEPVALPANRASDAQEQATFPSFLVLRQGNGLERLVALHSNQARVLRVDVGEAQERAGGKFGGNRGEMRECPDGVIEDRTFHTRVSQLAALIAR